MRPIASIFEVIDQEPEPFDNSDAIRMPKIEGRITFKEAHFGYDPGKPVLKGIGFDVKPGEMIGLVGKSGAGKSTLINLICRFYDPDRGAVLVDGEDHELCFVMDAAKADSVLPVEVDGVVVARVGVITAATDKPVVKLRMSDGATRGVDDLGWEHGTGGQGKNG